jgi:uncharacterized protein (DUF1697 family)
MAMNVALLRAVNLPNHKPILMATLRELFEGAGFKNVQTLLQTGNVIFNGKTTEAFLEQQAAKRLGLETDFFLRTADEWDAIVAANPFPREAKDDPAHLVVVTLKSAAKAFEWPGPEIIRVDGRNAYIVYPEGIGRSKLTPATINKRLSTRGTARNWNTVLKIQTALRASSPPERARTS